MLDGSHQTIETRTKVLDLVHAAVTALGGAAVLLGLSRVVQGMGSWWTSAISACLVGIVGVFWLVRRRISMESRATIVLGGMTLAGITALILHGLSSPAGVLLLAVMVLGWLLLSRPWRMPLYGASVVGFAGAAWWNIHHGTRVENALPTLNRSLTIWINVGVMYLLVGGIILAAVRVLVSELRSSAERSADSEAAERAAKSRLAGILAGIHDTVMIHDGQSGKILEVYGRYREMYGMDEDEILRCEVGQLSSGSAQYSGVEVARWFSRCLIEGSRTFPWHARRADGRLFWVEVNMRTISLEGIDRVVVTITDIDQSVRDNEYLRTFNSELEERVQERTSEIRLERESMEAFSYMVSHDLRAPLRGIDGFAAAMQDDFGEALPAQAKDYLDRIRRGASRMGRLIDALLSLSRLGRCRVERSTVDLSRLVEEIREELRQAESPEVRLARPVAHWRVEPLPQVWTDPELARQVLANVLSNAVKFSRLGPDPVVEVRAVARTDGTWIEITDNGPGFDPAHSDKLFKAFNRLHGDAVEGIGIGLATVRKIVDRLGGDVEVDAALGAGATFRFRLAPAHREPRADRAAGSTVSDSNA